MSSSSTLSPLDDARAEIAILRYILSLQFSNISFDTIWQNLKVSAVAQGIDGGDSDALLEFARASLKASFKGTKDKD